MTFEKVQQASHAIHATHAAGGPLPANCWPWDPLLLPAFEQHNSTHVDNGRRAADCKALTNLAKHMHSGVLTRVRRYDDRFGEKNSSATTLLERTRSAGFDVGVFGFDFTERWQWQSGSPSADSRLRLEHVHHSLALLAGRDLPEIGLEQQPRWSTTGKLFWDYDQPVLRNRHHHEHSYATSKTVSSSGGRGQHAASTSSSADVSIRPVLTARQQAQLPTGLVAGLLRQLRRHGYALINDWSDLGLDTLALERDVERNARVLGEANGASAPLPALEPLLHNGTAFASVLRRYLENEPSSSAEDLAIAAAIGGSAWPMDGVADRWCRVCAVDGAGKSALAASGSKPTAAAKAAAAKAEAVKATRAAAARRKWAHAIVGAGVRYDGHFFKNTTAHWSEFTKASFPAGKWHHDRCGRRM